jgi:hypothetical protein
VIGIGSREEECVLGVQQWAEVRRLVLVEGRSQREVARLTGLARDTVAKAVQSETPPRYVRAPAGSKLDPFKDWIGDRLSEDPTIQAQRLREMAAELGYAGGKTIFDDYVREVRPRYRVRRTFQRTIYRPGELVQCDLWEPRELLPVGHGQTRRGWVVTAEVCWSRVIAGALIFSKEAPDILWGLGRCLERIGALPERLVWDRESDRRGRSPDRRVRGVLRAARGRLDHLGSWGCAGEGGAGAFAHVHAFELPPGPAIR